MIESVITEWDDESEEWVPILSDDEEEAMEEALELSDLALNKTSKKKMNMPILFIQ